MNVQQWVDILTSQCLFFCEMCSNGAAYYAQLYRDDNLRGGHVIQLGPGNTAAARDALQAWPGGLQIGGGVNLENARKWLDWGASKVSSLFSFLNIS